MLKIKQKEKVMLFDWIKSQLDANKLEILFKNDHSGDGDFTSISSFSDLLLQVTSEKEDRNEV